MKVHIFIFAQRDAVRIYLTGLSVQLNHENFSPSCHIVDCTITKFLNRILGLEVHQQNFLFQYFTDNFEYLIEKDKKEGKYDMGILGKHQSFTQWLCLYMNLNRFILMTDSKQIVLHHIQCFI